MFVLIIFLALFFALSLFIGLKMPYGVFVIETKGSNASEFHATLWNLNYGTDVIKETQRVIKEPEDVVKAKGNVTKGKLPKNRWTTHIKVLILSKCSLSCIDGISERTRIWVWFLSILSVELGFHRRTCNIYPAMLGTYRYAAAGQD